MSVLMEVKEGDEVLAKDTFDWYALPLHIQNKISLHGLSTLLQQRTSDIKQNPLGKLDAMSEVYERLAEGEWNKERQAGARQVPAIVEVLAKIKGADIGSVQKAYAGLEDEQKDALKEKYADDIAKIEAGRNSAEVSLDDLL